jgi:hypothetical protein
MSAGFRAGENPGYRSRQLDIEAWVGWLVPHPAASAQPARERHELPDDRRNPA